jgi:methyl-accepting chemotaxis protein-1 (serine sensor receptor)
MLKNITIKNRLIFVVGFLSLQLIVGAMIGLVSLNSANNRMKTMYEDRLVALGQLDQVIRLLNRNQMALAKSLTAEGDKVEKYLAEVDSNARNIDEIWGQYMATKLTTEETALAKEFVDQRQIFIDKALKPAVTAVRAGNLDDAKTLLHGDVGTLFESVRQGINSLIKLQLEVAAKEFAEAESTYEWVRNACILGLLLGLGLAAVVGIWLIRAISHPIEEAVRLAGAIASGDLTQEIRVDSEDEMGRLLGALKSMNASLVDIVSQVRNGTDTIATASTQIASGNLDLSSRTEEQASSLEETASSMEELTTTVKQNADNARQANALAQTASDVAAKGGQVVSQVVSTMGEINHSSRKIVDIISVIDGIAFQTNILALNAAVEAARAGEQGRGFAVVASEVRNLAQRSASAAKEIKALIDASVSRVDAGSRLVEEAGTTMGEVVTNVKRVSDIVAEIMAASGEQSAGIEQINQAITQMDNVTQQNASLVEEAAAAAEAMQDQATNLSRAISVFKVNGMHAALPMGSSTRAATPKLPKTLRTPRLAA